MTNKKRIALVICSCIFLSFASATMTGCGSDGDGGPDIIGNWGLACQNDEELTLTFSSGNSFQNEARIFTDNSCTTQTTTITIAGIYSVGDLLDTSETIYNFDAIIDSATIAPASTDSANELNLASFLGFTDWAVDVPKSILGVSIGGSAINDQDQILGIMELMGNSLRIDADEAGPNPTRPTVFTSNADTYTRL